MCDHRMWGVVPHPDVIHLTPSAPSMREMAVAVLSAAPPRFALAGPSMGGILAMEVVAQAPDRVARLALLDANLLAEAPEVQARLVSQIARAATDLAGLMAEIVPSYFAGASPALEALGLQMAADLGPEVFAAQSRVLRDRIDQQATLRADTGPSLVLMGAQDQLCPRDRHEVMANLLPCARLRILPGWAICRRLKPPAPSPQP
jgi:pimeloyl-ACP methyl ester carboxylesterase